jgi:hypothetical protein
LCTSEVVAEGSAGRIGLWAVRQGYRRIGEWDSGGIGPHEVLALGPDRLAVANGGIATDPEDRRKLNLDRMRPSLVLLSGDGAALHEATLPAGLHQASIRHLAALPGGGLAFGCQWEGDPAEPVPVLGLWRPGSGEDAALTAPPEAEVLAMAGYAGSVASVASAQGPRIAVTSPRAGRVQIFDQAGVWIASHARADLCGLAAQGRGFVASDGQGVLWAVSEDALRPLEGRSRDLAWDNHLLALAPAAAG